MTNSKPTTEPSGAAMPKWGYILVVLTIVVAGILAYANSLDVPFYFDDHPTIAENPAAQLQSFSIPDIVKGLSEERFFARPVPMLTFMLNHLLFGLNVASYHVFNIAVHLCNALLLYYFVFLTLGLAESARQWEDKTRVLLAGATALLWVVHPLQVSSVTYICQRMNTLGTCFYLAAFILYIVGRRHQQTAEQAWPKRAITLYCLAGLSGLLAVLSKQNMATLPFFILLYEWVFFRKMDRGIAKRILPYLLAAPVFLFVLWSFYVGGRITGSFQSYLNDPNYPPIPRMLTETRVLNHYLSTLFFPAPARLFLVEQWQLSESLISPLTTLFSTLALTALLGLGIYLLRKRPLFGFAILWFFGNHVMESTFLPLRPSFLHRNYLPMMLLYLCMPLIIYQLTRRNRWATSGICALLACILGYATWVHNAEWSDKISFWQKHVNAFPNHLNANINLGQSLFKSGQASASIPYFRKAIAVKETSWVAHANLGAALATTGQFEEAILELRTSLKLRPSNQTAQENLKKALIQQQLAKKHPIVKLQHNVMRHPDDPEAHYQLGVVLAQIKNMKQAEHHFRETVRLDPNHAAAYDALGTCLHMKSQVFKAEEYYRKALTLNPDLASANYHMGTIVAGRRDWQQAVDYYKKAIKLNPKHAEAYNNLGSVYATLGKLPQAVLCFQQAVQLLPEYEVAKRNLERARQALTKQQQKDDK